jgi:fido (protein-threonine AMPylation protein)
MPSTTHTQTVIIRGTLYTVDYIATRTEDISYHDITFNIVHPFTGVTRELQVACLLYASEYTSGIDNTDIPLTVLYNQYRLSEHELFYHMVFCGRLIRAYHNGTDMRLTSLMG